MILRDAVLIKLAEIHNVQRDEKRGFILYMQITSWLHPLSKGSMNYTLAYIVLFYIYFLSLRRKQHFDESKNFAILSRIIQVVAENICRQIYAAAFLQPSKKANAFLIFTETKQNLMQTI